MKEKKIGKISKMILSLLVIIFIVQPVLQITINYESVFAEKVITKSSIEEIKASIGKDEYYKITKVENKYRGTYQTDTIHVKEMPECRIEKIKTGLTVNVNNSEFKNLEVVSFGTEWLDKKKHYTSDNGLFNHRENYYTIWFRVNATYESDFMDANATPVLPTAKVYYRTGQHSQSYGFEGELKLKSRETIATRYTATVYKRSSSNASQIKKTEKENEKVVKLVQDAQKANKVTIIDAGNNVSTPTQNYIQPTYEEQAVYQQQPVEVYVPIPENGTNLEDSQKRIFIRNLYKRVLQREPTDGELNGWAQQNPYSIARGIILSKDSQDMNDILNISSADYVYKMYNYILGRNCSAEEAAGHVQWLSKWNNRNDCINIFVNSPEFSSTNGKATKTITLNSSLCGAVYDKIRGMGYSVIKPSDTTLMMYDSDVSKVATLDLSGKSLTDITGLSVFTGLTSLNISNNKITNLEEVGKLPKLTRLIANDISLKGLLEPLQKLTNLEVLQLNNCGLVNQDIDSNLSKITSLKNLSLNLNSLTNVSSLVSLTNLEKLSLNNNEILTVGKLGTSGIKEINVQNNIIKISTSTGIIDNVDMINNVYNQNSKFNSQEVELTNCKFENGKVLLNGTEGKIVVKSGNAKGYTLYINSVAQKTIFNDKVFLDRLESQLDGTGVILSRGEENGKYYAYIDTEKAKTVENLSVKAGRETEKITDITGIGAFPNLKVLNLDNNKVSNLKELVRCKNIQTLNVRNNGLENLDDIKSLKSLISLNASNNAINQINGLLNMTKLEYLALSNNNIKNSLYPISTLTNLKVLQIDANGIDNFDYIDKMKIPTLYARYNQIKNTNGLDLKNYDTLCLGNNEVEYDIGNEMTTDLPDLIRLAVQEVGVEKLELTDCTIENNKIVINKAKRSARIKVKDGSFKECVVKINTRGDQRPPKLTVNYDLNSEEEKMTVTINADEEIYTTLLGWTKSEDQKSLTKVFNYNAKEVVEIKDLAGNATSQVIEVKGLYNNKVRGLSMSVSNFRMTNNNITVRYTADEPMYVGEGSMWVPSDGGKTLTRVIEGNVSYLFTVQSEENHQKALQLAEDIRNGISDEERDRRAQEIQDGLIKTTFEISNIDKVAPKCNVEYSSLDKTSGTVAVTVWSNEDIEIKAKPESGAEVRNGSHIDENGVKRSCVILYYSENTSEDVIVKDTAGNEQTVRVNVNNIDKTVENLNLSTGSVLATNQAQRMVISADEKIKITDSDTNSTNKLMARIKRSISDNEPILVLAGSINSIPIMYGNVSVSNSDLGIKPELIRIAEEDNSDLNEDGELVVELKEPEQGVIEVSDDADNRDFALVDTSYIDIENPVVSRKADKVNEDGSVIVTLVVDEQIKNTDNLVGWDLAEDGVTLTKRFTANANEVLTITDLAGNETEYNVKVTNIQRVKHEVVFEPIEGTEQALVVIQSDVELKEVPGWELLEDGKSLAKVFFYTESENVVIEDKNGNSSEVVIALSEVKIESKEDESKQEESKEDESKQEERKKDEPKQENNKQDTSPVPFPQTGVYMMISGSMIVILTALTVITLIRYKKNM